MAKDTAKQTRARLLCEKDGLPQPEIARRVGVSERTICNWSERGLPNPLKGPWVKGSLAAKVQEKHENAILQAAAELGMDERYFLGKVKQLCEATKPTLVKPSKAEQQKAEAEGDESGGGFVTEVPDFNAIDAGLTHAERIIPGLKAAEKMEHDFPAEMLAFFQGGK